MTRVWEPVQRVPDLSAGHGQSDPGEIAAVTTNAPTDRWRAQ